MTKSRGDDGFHVRVGCRPIMAGEDGQRTPARLSSATSSPLHDSAKTAAHENCTHAGDEPAHGFGHGILGSRAPAAADYADVEAVPGSR